MWITNAHLVARSCDLWWKQPNMNQQEISDLYDAIKQVAHETRVDHRFIFASIMQESRGCVRVNSTVVDNIKNTGVLQSYKGSHTCNDNGKNVLNPCPSDNILGQVRDGGKSQNSDTFSSFSLFYLLTDMTSRRICRGPRPSHRHQRTEQSRQQRNRLRLLPRLPALPFRSHRFVQRPRKG